MRMRWTGIKFFMNKWMKNIKMRYTKMLKAP